MNKRIAIFGDNALAIELMQRLDLNQYQIIYAANNDEQILEAEKKGFPTKKIDYQNDDDLKALGIGKHIDMLFCFFNTDCDNVFLTLSARTLDKNLEIIAIVDENDSADKLTAAGANKIINPYTISGRKIYERFKKPEISQVIEHTVFRRHDLNIAEILIPSGSYLDGTLARDLQLEKQFNLILIGIVDKELSDDLQFAIDMHDNKLDVGDILVVLGPLHDIRSFKKRISGDIT